MTFLSGAPLGPPLTSLDDPRLRPAPAPAAGYDGTGTVNSGIIGVGFGPNPAFAVKFSKAGTFAYICILHIDQGMGGTITVAAAQTAPAAPAPAQTGSAGLSTHGGGPLSSLLIAAIALVVIGGARVASGRVRRS